MMDDDEIMDAAWEASREHVASEIEDVLRHAGHPEADIGFETQQVLDVMDRVVQEAMDEAMAEIAADMKLPVLH